MHAWSNLDIYVFGIVPWRGSVLYLHRLRAMNGGSHPGLFLAFPRTRLARFRMASMVIVGFVFLGYNPRIVGAQADLEGIPRPLLPPGDDRPPLRLPASMSPEGMRLAYADFRLALEELVGSLHSIHLKYRCWDVERPDAADKSALREWAIQGDWYLDRCASPVAAGGPRKSAYWRSYDGEWGHQIQYWEHQPDYPRTVTKTREAPRHALDDNFLKFICLLSFSGSEPTPLQLLRMHPDPRIGLFPLDRGDGGGYGMLALYPIEGQGDRPDHALQILFSPDHSSWPKKVALQPIRFVDGSLPPGQFEHRDGERHTTMDFAALTEVDDPILGRPRPFPTKVIYHGQFGSTALEFVEIRVNQALPKSLFTPQLPIGVTVETDSGATQRTVSGGAAGLKFLEAMHRELEREREQQAGQQAAKHHPQAVPRGNWLVKLLLATSGCAVLVLGWIWYSRLRGT
jgi:hypothetical protein